MSIKAKTLSTVVIVFLIFLALVFSIGREMLYSTFTDIEQRSVILRQEQFTGHLKEQQETLLRALKDWSMWDDTYAFALGKNQGYVDSNFAPATYQTLLTNFTIILDVNQNALFAAGYDLVKKVEIPVSDILAREIKNPDSVLNRSRDTANQGVAGMLSLPEGPLMVAARPILKTDGAGPPVGTFIWGRYLDEQVIQKMGATLKLPVEFRPAGAADLPAGALRAAVSGDSSAITLLPLDEQSLAAYSIIADIHGQPAFVARTLTARDISRQGELTINFFLVFFIAIGALLIFVAIRVIDREVLSRILSLAENMRGVVSTGGSVIGRLAVRGGDEIASLTESINAMLSKVEGEAARRGEVEEVLRRKTELSRLQREIAIESNEAHTVNEALGACLAKICAYTSWEIGHVYLPRADGVFVSSDIWHGKGFPWFARIKTVSDDITFAPGEGLVGAVAQSGEPMFIPNVMQDKNFKRTAVMGEIGMKGAFAFPVLEGRRVAAVLEFFSWRMDAPDDAMMGAINSLALQMGRVTERKKLEETLQLSQRIVEGANEGVLVTGPDGVIISVNPAFTRTTGYTADEAVGNTPRMLKSGRHGKIFYQQMWGSLLSAGHWEGEIWNRRKNGEAYPSWLSISAIKDTRGDTIQYAAIFNDISEYKRSQQEIEYQAYHDALTGLPNRTLLAGQLKQAIARAHRSQGTLATLFLDLDNFKHVNDSLGHATGDMMLKGSAIRLVSGLREGDFICRFGGDEFVILLESVENEYEVITTMNRIIASLAEPYLLGGEELVNTVSVGVAMFPADGESGEDLLRAADMAMYHAKSLGRNTYQFFTESMNQRLAARLQMETNLRRAIERGELVAYYQPKLNLETGRITGMEALVRWRRPEGVLIPPNDFIPLAEETGLILDIDEWMLKTALAFARRVNASRREVLGIGVNVSINLSARDLERAELVETITRQVAESGVSPELVELELTESAIIRNVDMAIKLIKRLRDQGFNVCLDDFGTGYSSMNYLRRFAINVIKMDRSFVIDLEHDHDSRLVAQAIISLAHGLGMKVVAEGVETPFQTIFLKSVNCDEIQGYIFSRPVPGDEMERLIMDGKGLDGLAP